MKSCRKKPVYGTFTDMAKEIGCNVDMVRYVAKRMSRGFTNFRSPTTRKIYKILSEYNLNKKKLTPKK